MIRSYLLLIATVILVCCHSEEQEKERDKTAYDVDFERVIDQFCLLEHHFDTLSLADANTLFFLKSGRWDTSFVLILRKDILGKDTISIKGVYQEITPENAEASYKTDINFNTGFSFDAYQLFENRIITDSLWNGIVNEASSLLNDTVYHKWALDVDGTEYLLCHDSKFTVSKPEKNGVALERFAQYLRRALIYPAYRRKKQFDNRPNPNN